MYNPRGYANNLNSSLKIIKKVFDKNSKNLKWHSDPESILDLGIGDGRMTKEVILPAIPKKFKEYIGADVSRTMLETAKKTIIHDKFQTVLIDAQTKSLPNEMKNRFHHIFANYLLHHTHDTRQVFLNVKEMLKPGGQFLFNAFEEIFTDEAFEKLDQGKWGKYEHWKAISPFYKSKNVLEEYKKVIDSVGFDNCVVYTEKFDHRLPLESFEGLLLKMTCLAKNEFVPYFTDTVYKKCIDHSFRQVATCGVSAPTPVGYLPNALMRSVNARLTFVDEEDREEYMRDYIEATKSTKMTRLMNDEVTNERIYQTYVDIVTGIISKPI